MIGGVELSWQDRRLYGPRWPRHMLPTANALAALTACDLPTPRQNGTPEPMYHFGAALDLAMEPRAFVDELLAARAGDSAFCESKFLIHVGPAGAQVAHFTDAVCSICHPQELDPFKGFEEVFNAASSTFPDPARAWVDAPAPARYNPVWEAEDGGRKVVSLRFPLVPWVSQVQRLITVLPGQEMTYQAEEAEAARWLADPVPDPADCPLLVAEIGITAPDAHQLAQLWLNMAAIWRQTAAGLEALRLSVGAAIEAAETVEGLAASMSVLED